MGLLDRVIGPNMIDEKFVNSPMRLSEFDS